MQEVEKRLTIAIQQAQERIGDDFVDALLTLSYRYLDQYYLQVRRHSERSLVLTLVFAVFGGLTVLGGVLGGIFSSLTTQSYIATGAGLVVELLSAVFFYLYNQTTQEMNAYYDRLVLAQNLAVAIKAAELLEEEERAKEITAIIAALIDNYNKYLFENSLPLSERKYEPPKNAERKTG